MWRPLDVTLPLGTTTQFTGVDIANNPITVSNQVQNYGWEYVWHCHLLGHEENDMMRSMVMAVMPAAPSGLTAAILGTGNKQRASLAWSDHARNETEWIIQRSIGGGAFTEIARIASGAAGPTMGGRTYVD